jgi:hypothetical protein
MARRIESLTIPGPAGSLEARLEEPDHREPRAAALVCHPHPLYGGTMLNKVVHRLARGLRRAGCVALRFNFRGAGRSEGEHGNLAGEIEDARAALAYLRERYPELPYALSGFSFGSRVITSLGCEAPGAEFLMALGFATRIAPVDYLAACTVPKIFIHSTHDEFCPKRDFERFYETVAEPKQLAWIEAQDHFFVNALDELEEAVFRLADGAL